MVTNKENPRRPMDELMEEEIEVTEGSLGEQVLATKFDFNVWLQESIKGAPWWGISTAFHTVFLLIIGVFMVGKNSPPPAPEETQIIRPPAVIEEQKPLDMELPRAIDESPVLPKEDIITDTNPVWKRGEESDQNETDDKEKTHESKGNSYDFKSDKLFKGGGVYDMLGLGGGAGGRYGGPRSGDRNTVSRGSRGGRPTESAVTAGLYWLAKHQNPDGSWGAASFTNQCQRGCCCSGTGDPNFDVGLTGLALLAFTGANYTPSSRDTYGGGIKFGTVVAKAAKYLKDQQKPNGMYGQNTMLKFMYNQGIASYAMADLYTVMKDRGEPAAGSYRETALKGVQFVIDAQNTGKAWRYQPKNGENDMSVSGWCTMALKTAEEGKLISVPQSVWDGVKSHLDDVTDIGAAGGYGDTIVGYMQKGNVAILAPEKPKFDSHEMYAPPSLTSVGMMCRIFMGQNRNDAVIKTSAALLTAENNLPKWDTAQYGKIDYYYWFYSTYALYQFDGPTGPVWNKWQEAMVPVGVKSQKGKADGCANGSWDPIDRWSKEGGRVYSTAINVLTYEVYRRLRIIGSAGH